MRKEPCMERDQLQVDLLRQFCSRLNVLPVLRPRVLGSNSTSFSDRLQAGVIFTNAPEHPGNNIDVFRAKLRSVVLPYTRVLAQWIEIKLDLTNAGGLQF